MCLILAPGQAHIFRVSGIIPELSRVSKVLEAVSAVICREGPTHPRVVRSNAGSRSMAYGALPEDPGLEATSATFCHGNHNPIASPVRSPPLRPAWEANGQKLRHNVPEAPLSCSTYGMKEMPDLYLLLAPSDKGTCPCMKVLLPSICNTSHTIMRTWATAERRIHGI